MIRDSLHKYIYTVIIPKYAGFDKAHREDHALTVIDRALSMGRQYDIDEEMLLGSIYGQLVAEADRLIVPETIIRRTVQYGLSNYPELDKEGHWQRTLEHLQEKYAEGGYLHLLIPGSPNEAPLQQLREIIRDKTRLRTIFESVFAEERQVT